MALGKKKKERREGKEVPIPGVKRKPHYGNCANPFCGKILMKESRYPVIPCLSFILLSVKNKAGERLMTPFSKLPRAYICYACKSMFEKMKPEEDEEDEHRAETEEPESIT